MKKILGLSIIALVFIGLVAGGTFAYFSDTETSENNTFSAGTLVFNIQDPVTTGHQVYDVSNMKPGDEVTRYLVVVNDGTLDMKWRAWLTETGTGTLDEVLTFTWTLKPITYPSYAALASAGYTLAGPAGNDHPIMTNIPTAGLTGQTNTNMLWASPGAIAFTEKQAAVFKIVVKMLTTADNAYQGATYTGVLNFYATQYELADWPAGF
jgi:predicted ribosomally synthesized peptide with SipW-like signal peptide